MVVGAGQRLHIDHRGVTAHALSGLRVIVSPPPQAASDVDLQRTLGRWAGQGTALHVREVVPSGEDARRTVQLSDPDHARADFTQRGEDTAG